MKFKHYLETISGISIYPMISLGIFFIFFLVLILWAVTVKKEKITEMKNIPLN
jgi:cytochrome c oxidase cbb3-type subunit 3